MCLVNKYTVCLIYLKIIFLQNSKKFAQMLIWWFAKLRKFCETQN